MAPERFIPRSEATNYSYIDEILKRADGKILVVGFNGSNQKELGRLSQLLEQVLTSIDELGGHTVVVDLAKVKMDLPSGTYGRKTPTYQPERRADDVEDLRELIRHADGIVIATPVYWFNHSGLIQTLIEHLTPLEDYGELEGKVAGIIVTEHEEGGASVVKNLMFVLTQLGMLIAPYSGIFSRGPGRDLKWVREDMGNLGPRMFALIKATRGIDWDAPNGKILIPSEAEGFQQHPETEEFRNYQ